MVTPLVFKVCEVLNWSYLFILVLVFWWLVTSRKSLWCVMTLTDIKSQMEGILEVGSGGQCPLDGRPHNPATWFHPTTTTVVSPEPFPHRSRACRKTQCLTDTDLCSCGETQTMSHIVESCPLTKLNGGLSQLHSADDAAIAWLTNYGS